MNTMMEWKVFCNSNVGNYCGTVPADSFDKAICLGRDIWGMDITGAQPVEHPTNNFGHDEWKPFRFWLPAPGAVDHRTYERLEDSLRKFLQFTVLRRYEIAVTYQYTSSAAMTATVRVKDFKG